MIRPTKLECYNTPGRKDFPGKNTLAYWSLFPRTPLILLVDILSPALLILIEPKGENPRGENNKIFFFCLWSDPGNIFCHNYKKLDPKSCRYVSEA
jgi:hypothetical protein